MSGCRLLPWDQVDLQEARERLQRGHEALVFVREVAWGAEEWDVVGCGGADEVVAWLGVPPPPFSKASTQHHALRFCAQSLRTWLSTHALLLQERSNLEAAAAEIATRVAELDRRERALEAAEAAWSDRLQQAEAKQQVRTQLGLLGRFSASITYACAAAMPSLGSSGLFTRELPHILCRPKLCMQSSSIYYGILLSTTRQPQAAPYSACLTC
jgi:hypothetical protein